MAQEAAATDAHHHHDGEEKAAAGGAPDITNLHSVKIDNLSFDLTPDEITDMFMEFGELGDVYVPRNHYTQKSREGSRLLDSLIYNQPKPLLRQ